MPSRQRPPRGVSGAIHTIPVVAAAFFTSIGQSLAEAVLHTQRLFPEESRAGIRQLVREVAAKRIVPLGMTGLRQVRRLTRAEHIQTAGLPDSYLYIVTVGIRPVGGTPADEQYRSMSIPSSRALSIPDLQRLVEDGLVANMARWSVQGSPPLPEGVVLLPVVESFLPLARG